MFFCELPVGARYRFAGLVYTKTSMGGSCTTAAGEPDWCASHNTVELVEAPAESVTETPRPTQTTSGLDDFSALLKTAKVTPVRPIEIVEPFPLPPQQLTT